MFSLDLGHRTNGLRSATFRLVTNHPPDNLPELSWPRLLAGLVGLALAYAKASTSRAAAATCPNEQLRMESNINSATGQPYDLTLPECRAYEMVSPLGKQAHDANVGAVGPLVSPNGDAVGFGSEGAFAGTENYRVSGTSPNNLYIAKRTVGGWFTEAAIAPASVISRPTSNDFDGDASPDLSMVSTCGNVDYTNAQGGSPTFACAMRETDRNWARTPDYTDLNGYTTLTETYFWGSSSDLSDLVWQPGEGVGLLPGDEVAAGSGAIYETTGLGDTSPQLRIMSVNNEGTPLTVEDGKTGPYFGGARSFPEVQGSTYQAVSSDGQTVYFTAEPAGGGPLTLYARTGDFGGSTPVSPTTVEIAKNATFHGASAYQGASADGSKVFFITTEKLVSTDYDSTSDLYEYDFDAPAGHHYVQISAGGVGDPSPGSGAEVTQVIAISRDGSHIYFGSGALLTTLPNSEGQHASPGGANIYGYDTGTGEIKFVATAQVEGGSIGLAVERANEQNAQVTPDGTYLIFATPTQLVSEDTNPGAAIYRYDFQTGEVTWISHSAPGFASTNEGDRAILPAFEEEREGANADFGDLRRAISENGEYVVFRTKEKLQADDVNRAPDVYLWHNGTVSLISDGTNPEGVTETPAISASGSDVFFATTSKLVGQDKDELQDIYDARSDGGFPAPSPEPACSGEECQGMPSNAPAFTSPATGTTAPGGNLSALPTAKPTKPQSARGARELRKALAACLRHKGRGVRRTCEARARAKYGSKGRKSMVKRRPTEQPHT